MTDEPITGEVVSVYFAPGHTGHAGVLGLTLAGVPPVGPDAREGEGDYLLKVGADPGGVTCDTVAVDRHDALVAWLSQTVRPVLVTLHPRLDRYGASTRAEFTSAAPEA